MWPQVNVVDAAPEIIAALPGMTSERLNEFLVRRQTSPENAKQLLPADAQQFSTFEGSNAYRVITRIAFDNGHTENAEVVILLFEEGDQPFAIQGAKSDDPAVAVSIQNADKTAYVAPTVSTTAAAASHFDVSTLPSDDLVFNLINEPGNDSYPIAGPTYALAYQVQSDGPKGKALVEFLYWGLTTGQAAEGPLDYVALPSQLATKAIAAVDSITFNGKSLRTGQ